MALLRLGELRFERGAEARRLEQVGRKLLVHRLVVRDRLLRVREVGPELRELLLEATALLVAFPLERGAALAVGLELALQAVQVRTCRGELVGERPACGVVGFRLGSAIAELAPQPVGVVLGPVELCAQRGDAVAFRHQRAREAIALAGGGFEPCAFAAQGIDLQAELVGALRERAMARLQGPVLVALARVLFGQPAQGSELFPQPAVLFRHARLRGAQAVALFRLGREACLEIRDLPCLLLELAMLFLEQHVFRAQQHVLLLPLHLAAFHVLPQRVELRTRLGVLVLRVLEAPGLRGGFLAHPAVRIPFLREGFRERRDARFDFGPRRLGRRRRIARIRERPGRLGELCLQLDNARLEPRESRVAALQSLARRVQGLAHARELGREIGGGGLARLELRLQASAAHPQVLELVLAPLELRSQRRERGVAVLPLEAFERTGGGVRLGFVVVGRLADEDPRQRLELRGVLFAPGGQLVCLVVVVSHGPILPLLSRRERSGLRPSGAARPRALP